MSMSFGDKAIEDPSTLRGRDWPCLRQFGVFLENRVGRLHDLLRHIEQHDVRVVALSIVDSTDYAVARLILNQYERARELFDLSTFTMFERDVIGVELPNDPQPHLQVCTALLQAEVNIHYMYPLLHRDSRSIAVCVDDVDLGLTTLSEKGLRIITENDLLDEDDFL